jgi:opacity protein-like surface antigen
MKGMVGAVVLGSLLAVSAPRAADAQARGFVGVGGGVALPIGDFKDGYKLGWLGQVIGGVNINDMFGVRVDGFYGQHSGKTVGTTEIPKLKLIGALGDVTLSPRMSGGVSPYVLAGAGMVNGKSEGADGSTKFAWNAGAGARFKAGSLGLYLEARFLSVNTEGSKTNMIPITLGVRFGGN